ncbi:hypothetical protein P4Q63_002031 [Salmonella enterica]|nr:hypothetical protein [Salmonella enterica]
MIFSDPGVSQHQELSGASRETLFFYHFNRSVVITVVTMRMMKSAINKIISVIAVWHLLVTTVRTVFMFCIMAFNDRIAAIGIFFTDFQHMLINMITMRMVEMTIVQIINMITVPDSGMTAALTVLVRMVLVMLFIA